MEHEGIQVLAIGKNKWIILYFNNITDAHKCKRQLLEHIQEHNIIIITNNNAGNKAPSETSSTSSMETETSDQMILLDIPLHTSSKSIRSILNKYGEIESLRITKGNHKYNSAIFSFKSTKTDIHKIWAIPIEETMARIASLENHQETLAERNKITTRLYGIGKSTSASRIMSATKHLKVKTVHIPVNSGTGKRRNFAILGFENQGDLNRALASHVELFGCKTWWSTRDNTKMYTQETPLQESSLAHTKRKKGTPLDYSKHIEESSSSTSLMEIEEEEEYPTNHKQKNKKKKGKQPIDTRVQGKKSTDTDPWAKVITMLDTINSRLTKLEGGRGNNKKSHYTS
jgi:RNA recognition motif-containing protein